MQKHEFFDRDSKHYYFDDIDKVVKYCIDNHPEDVRNVLKLADDACNNYFTFASKGNMKQVHLPVKFEGEIN